MANKFDATRDAAAEVAETICRLFDEGKRGTYTLGGVSFELTDIARCSEFVRECNDAAAGKKFGGVYFGGTARETEKMLAAAGKRTGEAKRGNIVCFNNGGGEFGHIGLCLGNGLFAENTSSQTRGPGFVISRLSDMIGRISGYYQVLPARKVEPVTTTVRIIDHATGKVLAKYAMVEGGDHVSDQRKVYVKGGA